MAQEALLDVKEEEVEAVDYGCEQEAVGCLAQEKVDEAQPQEASEEDPCSQCPSDSQPAQEEPKVAVQPDNKECWMGDGSAKVLNLSGTVLKKLSDVQWHLQKESKNEQGLYDFVEVDCSRCKLDCDSGLEVARFLQKCPWLRVVKLHHNNLEDGVVEAELKYIFKSCPLLEEVHLSHNWLTEKSCWQMVGEAAKQLPERSRRPLWLRMEHNWYKDPCRIAQSCKEMWHQVPICCLEDGKPCSSRYCKHHARIHLPFMLEEKQKHNWTQSGKPWSQSWAGWGEDDWKYNQKYSRCNGWSNYSHRDCARPWDGDYGYRGREGRWRDSRSRSRTPPNRVRLRERLSPPRPQQRGPSPPRRRQRQPPPVRRPIPPLPRKAPTPPRPRRRELRQPLRRPITPEPVANNQRNRQAPPAPLPQVRPPPSPPPRQQPKLAKDDQYSSSYEYYSSEDADYSYDSEPQLQTRDVNSVVVPLPRGTPKGSVGRLVQKPQFTKVQTQRRELTKVRPLQQNRYR